MTEHVETDTMQNVTSSPLLPAEEDPVLQRYFDLLTPLEPSARFEDRVMAHVLTPAPRWVQRARERQRRLVDSQKVWWILGGLVGTSFASVTVAIVLMATNSHIRGLLATLLLGLAIPAWRTALDLIAAFGRQVYILGDSLALSGQTWIAITAALVIASAMNAWILYRLVYSAAGARLGLHAPS